MNKILVDTNYGKLSYEYHIMQKDNFSSVISLKFVINDKECTNTATVPCDIDHSNDYVDRMAAIMENNLVRYINSRNNGECIKGKFYDLDNMSLDQFMSYCKLKLEK